MERDVFCPNVLKREKMNAILGSVTLGLLSIKSRIERLPINKYAQKHKLAIFTQHN